MSPLYERVGGQCLPVYSPFDLICAQGVTLTFLLTGHCDISLSNGLAKSVSTNQKLIYLVLHTRLENSQTYKNLSCEMPTCLIAICDRCLRFERHYCGHRQWKNSPPLALLSILSTLPADIAASSSWALVLCNLSLSLQLWSPERTGHWYCAVSDKNMFIWVLMVLASHCSITFWGSHVTHDTQIFTENV